MTNWAELYPGEKMPVHVEGRAAVTARMPTPEELKRGHPPNVPLLIVTGSGPHDRVYSATLVELVFDDPREQPGADAVREAVARVLGIVGEQLGLINAQLDDLASAARCSPRAVTRAAALARAERQADRGHPAHGESPQGFPAATAV